VFKSWLDSLDVRYAQAEDTERERLVSITLDVIDAESLSVGSLVHLRTDKTALAAQLRANYAGAVEKYVDELTVADITETDAYALRDEFKNKMELDMKSLKEELGPLAKKTILSKEVAVAVAAKVAGTAVLTSSGVGALLGGAFAVGALSRLRTEYRAARDATFGRHPMAFLYAAKGVRVF
jgi:hypothetical protein